MGYPLEEQMTINDQVFIRPIRALHTIETAQIITLSTESKFTTACGKGADHWLHLPIEDLAAAGGGDTGDDVGAVFHAGTGVKSTRFSGDALDEQARVFVNENGHGLDNAKFEI